MQAKVCYSSKSRLLLDVCIAGEVLTISTCWHHLNMCDARQGFLWQNSRLLVNGCVAG
jgi:hypothetical protein